MTENFTRFLGFPGDGEMVFTLDLPENADTIPAGPYADSLTYPRWREGAPRETPIRTLFFADLHGQVFEGGFRLMQPHFYRFARAALGPSLLLHGDAASFEFRVYALDGSLTRIMRGSVPLRPVTPELAEAMIFGRVNRIPDPVVRNEQRARLESIASRDTVPAYEGLMVDREGQHFWVRDYPISGDPTYRWTVFRRDGAQVTRIETPRSLRIHEIGSDYVLGVQPDDLGVERIVLHDLMGPG